MPYILQERRKEINPSLNPLIEKLINMGSVSGDVKYVFMRMLIKLYWQNHDAMNIADGICSGTQGEYRRRLFDPYEDKKILENGDIFDA